MKKIITLTFIIIICSVSNVYCYDNVVVIPLIGATASEGDAVSADILSGKKPNIGGELGIDNTDVLQESNSDRVRNFLRSPRVVPVVILLILIAVGAIMSRKQGR